MKNQGNKYQEIFEKSPIGILFYDKNGKLIDANSSALQIVGVSKLENILGINLFDNPNINGSRDELFEKELIKFRAPLDFDTAQKDDNNIHKKSGTVFIDYVVSVTDSGFLMQMIDISVEERTGKELKKSLHSESTTRDKLNRVIEELRNAKEEYRVMAEAVPYGVWKADAEGKPKYASPAFLELIEMVLSDLKESGWIHKLPPEDVEPVIKKWVEHAKSGEMWDTEYRILGPDNEYHTVLARGLPIRDKEGNIISWVGINLDITERKEIEEKLQNALEKSEEEVKEVLLTLSEANKSLELEIIMRLNAEEELSHAYDNIQKEFGDINALHQLSTKFIEGDDLNSILNEVLNTAITIIKSDKGNIQLLDPSTGTLKIVANKNFNTPFLKFFKSVHPGEAAVCGTAMESLERVIVEDITKSPIFKSSDALEVLLNEGIRAVQSTPIISKTGELLGIISTHFYKVHKPSKQELNFIDILAKQAAEIIQRKKAEQEAELSRKRLKDVLDSINDPIYSVDYDWNIIFVNNVQQWNTAAKAIGLKKSEDLAGLDLWKTFPHIPGTILEDNYRAAMEKREIRRFEFFGKLTGHWYENSAYPSAEGITVITRDISERKKLEEELKKSHDNLELKVEERTAELDTLIDELKRSNAELQQFAYVSSHDLQEPLRTIASFSQLLERRYKKQLDSDADEFIEYIVEAAKRMQQLINDLLEYSRVTTTGKEFEPVDVNEVFDTVLSNLKTSIEHSNAEITQDALPNVMADKVQLVQLFQNLIGNAIKFRKCEEPLKIHISAHKKEEKNEYLFSVSDNGIGMEPQYAERIFVIFQRLHTIAEYKGTGIGLSIVKRVIGRHGGRIWVESSLGEGSTFYFTIPYNPKKVGGGMFLK